MSLLKAASDGSSRVSRHPDWAVTDGRVEMWRGGSSQARRSSPA